MKYKRRTLYKTCESPYMRIAGIRKTSLHDGAGVNLVVFFQGCVHKCDGCQNPETWRKNGGYKVLISDVIKQIEKKMGFISGVTFSGGDPVQQPDALCEIAKWCKGYDLKTTLYTGYQIYDLYEEWYDERQAKWRYLPFMKHIDIVIDGKFEKSRKKDMPFRGSDNQFIWKRGQNYTDKRPEWVTLVDYDGCFTLETFRP